MLVVGLEREILRLAQLDTAAARKTRIYFVQAGTSGPIKVGVADDPAQRLRDLQCANYEELRLLASYPAAAGLERWLHRHLKVARVRGEWFHPWSALYDVIADLEEIYVGATA